MSPLLLLLVLDGEVVTHHDEVTVVLSVLECDSKNITEDIKTGSSLTLGIVNLHFGCTVEELEEVKRFDDAADGFLFETLVSFQVAHVSTTKHAFDQELVVLSHTVGKGITELSLEATERSATDNRESPEAEIL